ncbi:cytochrome b/b6 domain-containing protein [Arthrobacter koreensis]|uniref:Cytochrome b/b6 domain-containing protein n=1 Tax=Arthrobacter koreensis TaxID=199136 RepID=A0ABY6FSH9_9MICC|nr:cytochrome b/b6 domain-containing protein [Arthrobacter koreensis]MEB7447150.1 cytochrome b/b6 domain-containing protein [Arthrobacter koreensis]UYB36075.1 cytochrome b/b6 domain-containing protein [Arthrobacter koreensis]
MSPTAVKPTARSRWTRLIWLIPASIAALALVVLAARWLRETSGGQEFLNMYPGHTDLPEGAPVGLPAWVGWQHFLNSLLLLLIVRSGWMIRTRQRPVGSWTRNNKGLIRTKNQPKRISLDLWFHLSLDVLWVLNGLVFYILLFATGQWMRLVPTSWGVFPNAASTALQYASLDWPTENGWVNYNSLQVLSYFSIVFIAAPLAILTGLRMSPSWPAQAKRLNKAFPIQAARALHFPVMVYFVLFIVVHVTLVLATGALRNLNHMYAASDGTGWTGFWFFAASLVVMVAAWVAARPLFLRPVAALTGKVSR